MCCRRRSQDPVQRRRGRAARVVGGDHVQRPPGQGLLRRVAGGRLQSAHKDGADQRVPVRQGRVAAVRLPRGRLQVRPELGVSRRAGRQVGRVDGGVQERVRAVQHGRVLLPRRPQQAGDVQEQLVADQLPGNVQVRVPGRLQLRVRRLDQHVHVQGQPERQLRRGVLPLGLSSARPSSFRVCCGAGRIPADIILYYRFIGFIIRFLTFPSNAHDYTCTQYIIRHRANTKYIIL